MLQIIALFIVSIFFPPAWFALIAYIIYLVATKKTRRNKIIVAEIHKSIALNREQVLLEKLYYESAKEFAAEHGATMSAFKNDPQDDCLFVDLLIGGEWYSVSFQRWTNGETMLTVQTKERHKEELLNMYGKDDFMRQLLEKS
jgi:hypothetical protein